MKVKFNYSKMDKLFEEKKKEKITATKIGEETEISFYLISKVRSNAGSFSLPSLCKLANYFNCKLDDLMDWEIISEDEYEY